MRSFNISENGSRAGVITFSWHAEHSIKLNDHKDVEGFLVAVEELPLLGATTRIDKALNMAKSEMFTAENGGRPNVPKLIILLTDGSQTKDADAVDPGGIAEELRQSGIKLIVVGIGKNVNVAEMLRIAGRASNVYEARNFDQLTSRKFIDQISKSSCEQSKSKYFIMIFKDFARFFLLVEKCVLPFLGIFPLILIFRNTTTQNFRQSRRQQDAKR